MVTSQAINSSLRIVKDENASQIQYKVSQSSSQHDLVLQQSIQEKYEQSDTKKKLQDRDTKRYNSEMHIEQIEPDMKASLGMPKSPPMIDSNQKDVKAEMKNGIGADQNHLTLVSPNENILSKEINLLNSGQESAYSFGGTRKNVNI